MQIFRSIFSFRPTYSYGGVYTNLSNGLKIWYWIFFQSLLATFSQFQTITVTFQIDFHFLWSGLFYFYCCIIVQFFAARKFWNKGHEKTTSVSNNRSRQKNHFCNFKYFSFILRLPHWTPHIYTLWIMNDPLNKQKSYRARWPHKVKAYFKRREKMCTYIYLPTNKSSLSVCVYDLCWRK